MQALCQHDPQAKGKAEKGCLDEAAERAITLLYMFIHTYIRFVPDTTRFTYDTPC